MTRTIHLIFLATMLALSGCAAVTNPVADGIPVNRLPPEILGLSKADLRPIPLTLLRQNPPDAYLLDGGDILAVVANEVIAAGDQQAPIRLSDQPGQAAVVGYPVPVREDGTISIPLLPPINVRGKSVKQVERELFDVITGKNGGRELVKAEAARVSVQLLQRRQYQVLVVREDAAGLGVSSAVGSAAFGIGGRNSIGFPTGISGSASGNQNRGFTVNLPAYENDVLRALNASGGLPGLDAKDEVVITRGGRDYCDAANPAGRTIRIPLRVYPEQPVSIREEDIILQEGDVISIESRDSEVFYTAGLIGSGVYPLPRNVDVNVLQAIALVRGPLVNGSFSQNAFIGSAVNSGVGNPNASLVTVLRQLPDQHQIAIRVDLNKALQDPRERVLIQPGDFIVMQERSGEAVTRYLTQTFQLNSLFNFVTAPDGNITFGGSAP